MWSLGRDDLWEERSDGGEDGVLEPMVEPRERARHLLDLIRVGVGVGVGLRGTPRGGSLKLLP